MIRIFFILSLVCLTLFLPGCAGAQKSSHSSKEEEIKSLNDAKADAEAAEKKLHELRTEKVRLETERQKN